MTISDNKRNTQLRGKLNVYKRQVILPNYNLFMSNFKFAAVCTILNTIWIWSKCFPQFLDAVILHFQLLKYCCISLIRKNSDLNELELQKCYNIKWVSKEWSSIKFATENAFQKIFLNIIIKLHIFRYQISRKKSSNHILQLHHKSIPFQVIYTLLNISPCNPSSCLVVTR